MAIRFRNPDLSWGSLALSLFLGACGGGGGGGGNGPGNQAPQALAGADQAVVEGSAVTLDGSASFDNDGHIRDYEWIQIGGPAVTLADADTEAATFTAPSTDATLTLDFRLNVTDNKGASASDEVRVTVTADSTPVNAIPVAANDTATTNEDAAATIDVLANDSDADGASDLDPASVAVANVQNGAAAVNGGQVVFTPAANFHGTGGFSYTVRDDQGAQSNVATVTISVASVNDAPAADATSAAGEKNKPVNGQLTGSDVDGDALGFALATAPAHGDVNINASGRFNYTPASNYTGDDSFTFTVSDGVATSAPATVGISITAGPNSAPHAADDTAITAEDAAVAIDVLANDTDEDGASDLDPASITLAEVQNGSAVVDAGRVVFTPVANFNGAASFSYTIRDQQGAQSSAASVAITVTPVNDAPVAYAASAWGQKNRSISGQLAGNDIDGDALSFGKASDPEHGTLTFASTGAFTYAPAAGYTGTDSFTFTVSDGVATSAPATISITITADANSAPQASDDLASTAEDSAVTIDVLANDNDADGADDLDPASIEVTDARNGTATVEAGKVVFRPRADFNGTAGFIYSVRDRQGAQSNFANVTITVSAVNDPPTISDVADVTIDEDGSTGPMAFTIADIDSDPAALAVSASNGHGPLVPDGNTSFGGDGTNRTVTVTPAPDQNGAITITLYVSDGAGEARDTFRLTVTPVNDAPEANATSGSGQKNQAISGQLTGSDIDGDALSFAKASDPAHGTVTVSSTGSYTYTPAPAYTGTDGFTFTVSDGTATSAPATVSLTITSPGNAAPRAFDDGAIMDEDSYARIDVLANDVDTDSGLAPETITIVTVSHGVAYPGSGAVSFLPDANYFGTDAGFTYTVDDTDGSTSNAATVAITVNPVNDRPVVSDVAVSGDEETRIAGTVTGSDVEGDALTFAVAYPAEHGAVEMSAQGDFTYTPNANFSGTDSFTFTANDGQADSGTGTVTITVVDQPEATLSIGDATVAEDAGSMTFTVTLSRKPDTSVMIHYATADGTAKAGSDYTTVSGELVFDSDVLSQSVTVPVNDDAFHEQTETFTLALRVVTDPDSVDPASDFEATGTVTDQDPENTTLLRIGAAKRSIQPTQAQIDGIEEERAFGAGTHLQKFNLGGFGTDVGQNLPDPVGEIPAQATSTEPAGRRVFVNAAGREEHTQLRLFVIEQLNGASAPDASAVPGVVNEGGNVAVFVMIDAIGAGNLIQRGVKQAIIDAAAEQGVSVAAENILFGQTHSHTAADLQGLWGGVPQDWVSNVLYAAARDAAAEAFGARRPAHLSYRQGYTSEFNNYRRPRIEPTSDADGTITLLEATAEDGSAIGSILQYNAHPTSVGDGENPRTPHAEYILGAMEWLEAKRGGTALYFNGPIADASPSGGRPGCNGSADGAYGHVRCRGEGIADYLLQPGNAISGHELAPTLELRSTQVVLPITNPAFLATAAAGSFNRYYNFAELPTDQVPGLTPEQAADLPQVAPVAVTTVSRVTLGGAEAGLEIVSIPGETTNTMGNYIRGLAKTNVMLMGLTHNSFGYILPEDEFSPVAQDGDDGFLVPFTGYEENVSLGPLTAPLLRSVGYNQLFAAPANNVPPTLTSCLDGAYSANCVVTMLENRANLLIGSVEACAENGLTGDGCPIARLLDFFGIGEGTLPGAGPLDVPVLDTRLIAASADAQLRGCDILDTAECLFPFPNDWFTVPAAAGTPQDAATGGTGKRINLNILAMPRNVAGKPIDPTEWNRNDGFSPGQLIVTYVPGIGTVKDANHKPIGPITGAVPITDLPRYLDQDAPIVVIDATEGAPEYGTRHPIWAEIDLNAGYLLPMQGFGPREDAKPALLIRPATNFLEGHRYVVVLRNLENDYGAPLWAAPAFTACRDRSHDELAAMPTVQARCDALAANVFPVLADAGIARDARLYLAWDFTVASKRNNTARIVAMRDDAFANVLGDTALSEPGEAGYPGGRAPTYVVTKVTENPDGATGRTVRRVQGTLTVPSYVIASDPSPFDANPEFDAFRKALRDNNADALDAIRQQCANSPVDDADPVGVICDLFDPSTGAGASLPPNRLNFLPDASSASDVSQARWGDGLPDRNVTGDLTTTFTCNIPRSAVSGKASMDDATQADIKPARPTLYGHGLLGGHGEGNGQASDFGNVYGLMNCMTDWFGFASGDVPNVATALVDLSNFPVVPDGAQQGVLNMLFLARLATHPDGFAADPNFQVASVPVFDRREVFYHGNSQGGIMGGVVVAASKDINRGVLGVLGMNYSTLLSRSTDFALYSVPLYLSYQDDLQRPFVMSLMQMLWDRAENNGYAGSMADNSAMRGPDNAVLLQPAMSDHQVTMWTAEVMARTIGAKLDRHRVRPSRHPDNDASEYFGLPEVDYAGGEIWTGSALAPYDQLVDADGVERWNSQNDGRCDNLRTDPAPIGNVPPNREVLFGVGAPFEEDADSFNKDVGGDPHECPRRDPQARCQQSHFLLRAADGSGDTAPSLVPVDHIAVFGPSADTDAGCPAVVITRAPYGGAQAGPGFFPRLVAALDLLVEQLSDGDVMGAYGAAQGVAFVIVDEITGQADGIVDPDVTGPGGIWLAGDLHVHDDHSSDGSGMRQTLGQGSPGTTSIADQIAFAEAQGLDFLPLTDHRTFDQHYDPQWTSDSLLLITGEEANSSPHANVFGAMDMINQANNPAGTPEFRRVQQSIWDAHAQGAAWQTNHPDDGETASVNPDGTGFVPNNNAFAAGIDLAELWNRGGLTRPKIGFAENRWNAGYRFGIAGASDNHFRELWAVAGPGTPLTRVFAAEKSTMALLQGLKAGRTTLSLNTRAPRVTLTGDFDGDGRFETVGGDERIVPVGETVTLRVTVTNGAGTTASVYRTPGVTNGAAAYATFLPVQAEQNFDFTVTADAAHPQDWYRVELRGPGEPDSLEYTKILDGAPQESFDRDVANQLRAATSPIFISTETLATPDSPQLPPDNGGAVEATPAEAIVGSADDNAFAGFADVAEADGLAHVVAEARIGAESHVLYRTRFASGEYSAPIDLTPRARVARQPAIAAKGSDVWVVWQEESGDEMPHDSRINAAYSFNGGRTWGHRYIIQSSGHARRPDVALRSTGQPVFVWERNIPGGPVDIEAKIGTSDNVMNLSIFGKPIDGGNRYDSRSRIYPASVSPKLAIGPNDQIAVAWQDNRFDEDPGWTGHMIDPNDPEQVSASVQEPGFIEQGTETDDWEILAVVFNGDTWSGWSNVSNSKGQADRHAAIAFAPDGTLHVAWDSKDKSSSAGPRLEIRTNHLAGTKWSAPQSVAKNPNFSSQRPVFGADAGGLSLFWMDGRSSDWRWRVRRAVNVGTNWPDAGFVTGPGNATWPSYANGWLAFTSDRNATREQRKPHQVFLMPLAPATPPPDADGDGVSDASDQCPNEAGPASNNGCPVVTPTDSDGDGVPDAADQCPTQAGPASNNGCPVVEPPPPDGFPLCEPVSGDDYCISDIPLVGAAIQDAVDTVYNAVTGGGTPPPPVEHASCAVNKNLDGEDNYQVTLTSESGQTISFQVMEPKNVDCATKHPLILQGHGFGGSRTTDRNSGSVRDYLAAGYTIISIDQRGFGDSSGTVRVMDPDFEGKDLVAILDWAEDNLDYLAYRDDNLLVGAIGGSYGGGYQFLLHNVDPKNRLDALAPDVTWHDLRYSLNPGDTLKSAFGLLLSAGGEAGSYPPGFQNGESPADRGLDPYIVEVLTRAIATGEFPREALDWFRYHSPSYWCELNDQPSMPYSAADNAPFDPNTMLGGLAGESGGSNTRTGQPPVDVLISQGFRDTLFNVNDAWWNYQCAKARGGDVRMITHQSGHILDPASLVSNQIPRGTPLDIQAPPGSSNCGSLSAGAARLQWFNQKLRGAAAGSAVARTEDGLCISLADGDAVTIPAAEFLAPKDPRAGIPQGATAFYDVDTGVASVPNGVLAQQLYVAGQPPAVAPLLEVSDERGLLVAGLAHATLTVTTPAGVNDVACAASPFAVPTARTGCDSISLVGLGVLRTGQTRWTLIDDQLTPVRGLGAHTLYFAGVAERLRQGDQLGLLVYGYHPQYLGSYSRDPSIPVVNVAAQLELPLYAVGADGAPDFAANPAGAVRPLEFSRANACSDPGTGSVTPECLATGTAQQMLRTVCDYQWIPEVCAFDTLAPEGRGSNYAVGDDPHSGQPLFQVAGAVHNHSGYSDGDPSAIPADYFRAARVGHNVSDDGQRDTGVKLDFMLGSEHSDNEKLPVTTAAVCVEGFAAFPDWSATTVANFLSCSNVTGDDHYFKWQAELEQAIEATERSGEAYTGFTGMRGFEYTNDYYNHLNVYLSSNVANVKIDGSLADINVFWDWLREPVSEGGGADALVTFNHPGGNPSLSPFDGGLPTGDLMQATKGGTNWNDVAYVDEEIDQRVFGMEVNGGDDIEFFVKGLTNGWHLSPVANEDEHQREWSTSNDGKTLVYLRGRSPQDYYHALKNRRTAAVHNALVNGAPGTKVQVPAIQYWADGADFQAGQPLGSIVEGAGEHTLGIEISGLAQEAKVALIGRTGGAQAAPIALGTSSGGTFSATHTITAPVSGEDWYFVVLCPASVEVCDADASGYFGLTAPIWFKAAATGGDADGDGVPDATDQCAGTPAGTPVDANGCPVQQGGGFPLCADTMVDGEHCVSEIPFVGPAIQALADALLGGGDPAVPYSPTELVIDCTGPAGDFEPGTPEFTKRDADNIYCTTERHPLYAQHPANNPYGLENYGADPYRAPDRNANKRFRHAGVDIAGLDGQRGTSYSFDGATAEVYLPCAEGTCADMPEGLQTFEPPYPVAIVMHGAASDKKHLEWVTQPLAERGYFVLTANGTGNGLPDLLLAWLFDPANPYKDQLDLSRIGTAGHSLGAENATRVQGDARVSGIVAFDPCDGVGGNFIECRNSAGSKLHGKGAAAQTPTLFLAADYLGFPGWPQPQVSVPGDLRVEGFGILRENGVDTMLVTPRATTHLDWAGAFTFGNRLNEATSLYYTLAWFDRYVKARLVVDGSGNVVTQHGRNDAEELEYRQAIADGAFTRLTASKFDGMVDLHNISQGYYDRLKALDSGDIEYGGNVPFTVKDLALADRLSFYHRSVCFISRPDYAAGNLAARADTTEDGDMRASGCVVTQEPVDTDGDGVPDASDAFPNDPTESADADADGTGNNADTDDDNDGVADGADQCPTQAGTGANGCAEDSFRMCDPYFGSGFCMRDMPIAGALIQETANTVYDMLNGGGSEPPPPPAGGSSLASCAVNQDPAACQAAFESFANLQHCDPDESGLNCAYEVVHDAIGVDTAANYLHALFAQCAATPAAPACGAIRSLADGSDAVSLPVLSRPIPRGDLVYTEADNAPPSTKAVDGAIDDWMAQGTRIGGTDLYEFGEHVYSDFLFDAFGGDSGDDAQRWAALSLAGEFSSRTERVDALQQAGGDQLDVPPPGGTTSDHYGDRANREDGTDLTEVRWAADADDLYFLARVARLQDPANLAVLILADTDNATAGTVGLNAGLSTSIFDRAVLLRAGGGELRNISAPGAAGSPAVAIDTAVSASGYDNALEARIPRAMLERTDGSIRVAVMTVRVAGNQLVPANVAYRFDEPVTIYSERAQALALFAGTVDSFARQIRVQDLAGGRTQSARPGPGYHERQFVSGANISREGAVDDNGWEQVEQGRLQPYGVFVPSALRVNTLNQARMTIWTHYRGGKAHSGAAWTPRLFWQLGEEQGNIVVSPRARSESSWYTTRAHQDFFEVFADVAGTGILRQYAQENLPPDSEAAEQGLFFVDPAHVYISGYSMGGYATYLFSGLYPDLFAAGFGQSGAVTQGAWTGVGPDAGQPGTEICGYTAPEDFPEVGGGSPCFIEANDGRANAQLNFRLLENTRYVPISIHHGTNDELALTPGAARMGARLAELQYRYDATTFIGYEHFTQAIVDEWRDGAHYLNLHERPENPRAVTYQVVPALVEAVNEVQLKGWNDNQPFAFNPDGAYWVDGLVVRDAGCDGECPRPGQDFASEKVGRIDAESGRLPGISYVPVPRTGTDVDSDDPAAFAADPYASTNVYSPANHSTPFVRHSLAWQKVGDVAGDANTFSATLANLSAATLDLARMGQHFDQPIDGSIKSDGAATLTLANVGADMTVCVDGAAVDGITAGGDAVIALGGDAAVRLVPGLGAACDGVSPPPATVADRPGVADVCLNIGLNVASPVCAQLRDAQAQVRAECEAQGGGAGECSLIDGNAHAIVEACYENSGGDWQQQRDGAPLPVCRAVDAFVQGAAGICRDLTSTGYYTAPVCALVGGILVSESEMERHEASWTHRALKLQDRLGFALPLAHNTLLHTHNSFNSSTASTPTTISNSDFNQYYSLTDQLRMGVRAIELDVHWMPGDRGLFEPVVCHGRGGNELNAGCTTEDPLHYALAGIRYWLDYHPDDVIMLYIEDDLGGSLDYADESHAVTAQVVEEGLGELVYRPADHGSSCSNSEAAGAGTSWLDVSRQQMLDAGKQVLLITESCAEGQWSGLFHQKNDGNWRQGTQGSYAGFGYDSGCRMPDDAGFMDVRGLQFTRVWEDTTVVTAVAGGGAPATVTPAVMRELVRCGMSLPGVDRLVPRDGRLEAAVWSWAKDEPVASDTKNCAALNAAGRFFAAECAQVRKFACVDDANPAVWSLSSQARAWSHSAGACRPGTHFGVPGNGYANEKLKEAASGAEVWLNYGDAAADGAWVGDKGAAPATVGSPGTELEFAL